MTTLRTHASRSLRTAAVLLVGGLALSGCAPTAGGAASTETVTATPDTTPTPTPTATPTPAPSGTDAAVNVPTSCDQIGTAQSRAATVDTLERKPDPRMYKTRAGDLPQLLGCAWAASGVGSITVFVLNPSADQVDAYIPMLEEAGATCEVAEPDSATCVEQGTAVDSGDAQSYPLVKRIVYRDGIWLQVEGMNIDIDALTDDTAKAIWG